MYRDIPEDLRILIEPIVEDAGYELVNVLVTRGRPAWDVKVTIDTPQGDGHVAIDDCARVSRETETNLDASDAIPSAYRLEVSSPGLDRVLAREKDFIAACGSEVKIETRRPLDGRKRFRGVLERFDEDVAHLKVDGLEFAVPFAEVSRAHKVYSFTSRDFASEAKDQ
jgi:ribosome maturation factor RimP